MTSSPEAKVQATMPDWQSDDHCILGRQSSIYWLAKRESTIHGEFYANLLDQMRIAARENRSGKHSKDLL